MVANVGNTILGTFNAVQNASLNRERIANARLEREQNQLKFRQLEDLDAHDTLIKSGTQNGYIDSTQGFKLNTDRITQDLNSSDENIRTQAQDFSLGILNRSNRKDPFTVTGLEKNSETGKYIMTGRNPDGSSAPITEKGTAEANDIVSQFDPEALMGAVGTVYRGRILPRSSVDPVIYQQYNAVAGPAIGAALDAAEATGINTATRETIGVINAAADDTEAANIANQITTDLGGEAPKPTETEPVEESEEVEPLLLNATRDQKRNIERLRMMVARGEKNPATQTNPAYAKRLEQQKAELAALEQEVNDTPTGRLESGEQRRYASLNKRIANLNKTLEGKDTTQGIAATQARTLAKLTSERDALVGQARELANPPAPEVLAVAAAADEATGGDPNKLSKNVPQVSQSDAQAVAKSAQDAGVRTPADIVKLGPRQRTALIASVLAYTPKSQRNDVFKSFVNYLDTGSPSTSTKDALTASTSAGNLRRGLATDRRAAADQYSKDVATVGSDYVAPIVNGVWNEEDREFIAPTQDARVAATQLRSLAATAKQGGSLGLAAASQYLNGIMPLLIAEGKQTGDGFFGRIADIFRDDATLQIGNMADLIVVQYDGKDPLRLKFKDPAGGFLEEELTWKELSKVADSATRNAIDLAYKKRLEAESKQQ